MAVKLLTEHNLEFLSSKGGCTGSSESTLVKMPHCLKSHVVAHLCICDKYRNIGHWCIFFSIAIGAFVDACNTFVLQRKLVKRR